MFPKDCQGCDKCGTTLAVNPDDHRPVKPHNPEIRYSEKTGDPDHYVCTECHERLPLNIEGVRT